jgi:altronate hydrolase
MIVMAAADNVGIALKPIAAQERAAAREGVSLVAREEIPAGHKIALKPIGEGERILRFGVAVGIAKAPIGEGRLVHIHNVKSQYLDNAEDHFE